MKEELVTGFNGDTNEMNVVYITLYLITNYFAFEVLVGFLATHFSWFKWVRTDIYKNSWKILFCSLFDITCSILPIILVIAEYKHVHLFHLCAFGFNLVQLGLHGSNWVQFIHFGLHGPTWVKKLALFFFFTNPLKM